MGIVHFFVYNTICMLKLSPAWIKSDREQLLKSSIFYSFIGFHITISKSIWSTSFHYKICTRLSTTLSILFSFPFYYNLPYLGLLSTIPIIRMTRNSHLSHEVYFQQLEKFIRFYQFLLSLPHKYDILLGWTIFFQFNSVHGLTT